MSRIRKSERNSVRAHTYVPASGWSGVADNAGDFAFISVAATLGMNGTLNIKCGASADSLTTLHTQPLVTSVPSHIIVPVSFDYFLVEITSGVGVSTTLNVATFLRTDAGLPSGSGDITHTAAYHQEVRVRTPAGYSLPVDIQDASLAVTGPIDTDLYGIGSDLVTRKRIRATDTAGSAALYVEVQNSSLNVVVTPATPTSTLVADNTVNWDNGITSSAVDTAHKRITVTGIFADINTPILRVQVASGGAGAAGTFVDTMHTISFSSPEVTFETAARHIRLRYSSGVTGTIGNVHILTKD